MKGVGHLLRAASRSCLFVVLAVGCSAPYEPDPQFWPGDSELANAGGTSPQDIGSTVTGGSSGASSGASGLGAGVAGTAGQSLGGTSSASGGFGGASNGGAGNSAGAGTFGGSAGAAGNGGSSAGGMGASGSSAGGMGVGGSGAGGSAGSGGSGGGTSSANCSLTVKVTTAPAGGRYAPRNIGAVWVADESGKFIRSLEVWAQRRANHLTKWNAATSAAGVSGSRVDIVSQATLTSHVAHTSTWNCQDFNKKPVPDGSYRVYFEMSDESNNGPSRFEAFTKGPNAATSSPADNNNFKSIQLSFKP